MKKILLLFLLWISCLNGQETKDFSIKWVEKSPYFLGQKKVIIPQFDSKNFGYSFIDKTLTYSDFFTLDAAVTSVNCELTNVKYEDISQEDLQDLNINSIKESPGFTYKIVNSRDLKYLSFYLNPIVKNGGVYKKIIAFSINYTNVIGTGKVSNVVNLVQNSVLASGEWYKCYIQKSGVYIITKSFLQSIGFNVNIDPRTIKLYGNGGRMLPLSNNIPYPNDLAENAIQFIGEEDGVFNEEDYIIFYGEGVDNWNEESLTHVNLYADKSYYFLTYGGNFGKRIQPMTQPAGASTLNISNYDGYVFHEVDLINPGKIGRRWFGDGFDIENTKDFSFVLPNYELGSTINLLGDVCSISYGNTNFNIKANGVTVEDISFPSLSSYTSVLGLEKYFNKVFNASSNSVTVSLSYNNGGVPSSRGYLDYLILKYKAELKGYGKQFQFSNELINSDIGVAQFTINNASGIKYVWDITDLYNVTSLVNSNSVMSFKVQMGQTKKFVAVDLSDLMIPAVEPNFRVANQNLKGTVFNNSSGQFEDVDYLIISPAGLSVQAESLANFHRNNSNMKVRVISTESIFLEFGGGKQDIAAIRNFIKYVYYNASSSANRVKYVNLFGDASYDYKNRIPNNNNIVPIFHGFDVFRSLNSNSINVSNFSLLSSFMSDDFFVMMDDNEGGMPPGSFLDGLDIAVGRMLVSNPVQAQEMVNKVFEYHDYKSYGRWRNNLVYYADDPDPFFTGDYLLQKDLNTLADQVSNTYKFFNTKKIYTDAYVQEVSAGGPRYPIAKKDFIEAIQLGSLVVNYYGHGNEESFAIERIFEKVEAQELSNRYRYPLFITITCEFTRFDDPNRPTGGEYMYWNNAGGAISLLATTRQIFQSVGKEMNEDIYANLFITENNQHITISEALRRAKNLTTSDNRRVVFYVGDPALKLAIPKPKVVLTKLNDEPISTTAITLQALSLVKLSGELVDENNNLMSNYNGELAVQVYDKPINRQTLANDGATDGSNAVVYLNFNTLGEVIFRGNASVTNGVFEFSFVVPQDIQIPVGNGRISFYAKRSNPLLEDQTGYDTQVKVGGVNVAAPQDNIPPKVRLYMNDTNFVSGGITNDSPVFLAFLEDEHGINTASGIGHDIVAILDGDENNPYILNDYYETENNDYTKGKVSYPFRNLAVGLHTILFKAWDVYNNLITAEIQFLVVGDEELALTNVLNYPNPFVNYTEFWFNHNRPYEPLDVQVQILTITGKLVKTINQTVVSTGFLSREIKWDGKDDFGDRIGKGVYVYKLTVKSTITGKRIEKIEKLVIL